MDSNLWTDLSLGFLTLSPSVRAEDGGSPHRKSKSNARPLPHRKQLAEESNDALGMSDFAEANTHQIDSLA